jgi:glycine oxidase
MSQQRKTDSIEIAVIGGGVIGLATGWRLARSGKKVVVFEKKEAGRGAGWASAGMLAPQTEAGYEQKDLLEFSLESLRKYPEFLRELTEDSGIKVEAGKTGSLFCALNRDDLERLQRFFDFRQRLGFPVMKLKGEETREKEPYLSPRVTASVFVPDDWHLDSRKLLAALKTAFINKGGLIHEDSPVTEILLDGKTAAGIKVLDPKTKTEKEVKANTLVLAAGAWSSQIKGLPENLIPPIRPIKGMILNLKAESCPLSHVIRAEGVYLVPKQNGRLLVGATSEEKGYDVSPLAGGIKDLLQNAFDIVPGISECPLEEIQIGLRPANRDHSPVLGPSPIQGLYYAAGHYRHGILLAPMTALEVSHSVLTGDFERLKPFSITRFFSSAAA